MEDWISGIDAMKAALELEKTVNQSLLDLHAIATRREDAQVCILVLKQTIVFLFCIHLNKKKTAYQIKYLAFFINTPDQNLSPLKGNIS